MAVLTIGNSSTYEVEAFNVVKKELEKYNQPSILFRQDKCLEGEYLTCYADNERGINYRVVIDDVEYSIDNFDAIWYLKPHLPKELLSFDPPEHRQFIHAQFRAMRKAIWDLFADKKWVDNPRSVQKVEDKLYQLQVAHKVGFTIPKTIVTSNPATIRNFYQENDGNIITKVLGVSPIMDHVIMTNRVSASDMEAIDSLRYAPAIFQVEIPKSYELRITIVGEQVFAAKIFSQENPETALDWRKNPKLNDFEVKMEPIKLPSKVIRHLLKFMKELNLRFGCIDMIVTPEKDYVFLEINPNGQWYFIQLKTEMEIARAIAKLLVH